MRRSSSAAVAAAGGMVLLLSLYLPWLEAPAPHTVLNLFTPAAPTVDGWGSGLGDAAALADLFLVGVAALFFLRPGLARRLPLGRASLLAFYLTVAVGVQARWSADIDERVRQNVHFHFAYGAYLGFAAAAVVLLASVPIWEQPGERSRRGLVLAGIASIAVVALLVTLLLPWAGSQLLPVDYRGIVSPAAVAGAAVAIWLLARVWSGRDATSIAAAATALPLLVGAAFSSALSPSVHRGAAWLGLSLAAATFGLVSVDSLPSIRMPRPSILDLATAGVAGLLVASMFLPWQSYCYPRSPDYPPLSGRCASLTGWSVLGTVAAALAMVAIFVLLARRLLASVPELGTAIALLVATVGFELVDGSAGGVRAESGYGSKVGFAAAAAFAVLAVVRIRVRPVGRRDLVTLLPAATCIAYLGLVVVPWWGVLPEGTQDAVRFAEPSWLTIAGVVVAVRLLRSWLEAGVFRSELIVLLPLGLLSFAAVDLIRLRDADFTWGEGLVVGFSLLLALLGWLERRQGLEGVPEALRIDRI